MDWLVVVVIVAFFNGLVGYWLGTNKAEKLFKEHGNYRDYIRFRYDNR